mmetsp:Transcript_8160/g.21750  ORF Transcript_8160/g.21750 Transcript_8160/m.21750 type:complete len:201 (+) Transcript_8160:802-1404(+)
MARVRLRFQTQGTSTGKPTGQQQKAPEPQQQHTEQQALETKDPKPETVIDLTREEESEQEDGVQEVQDVHGSKRRRVSDGTALEVAPGANELQIPYQQLLRKCARQEAEIERLSRELMDANAQAIHTASTNRKLAQQRQEATHLLDLERRKTECPVCLDKPKIMALVCGHLTCPDCSLSLSHCPQCRVKNQPSKIHRVYL